MLNRKDQHAIDERNAAMRKKIVEHNEDIKSLTINPKKAKAGIDSLRRVKPGEQRSWRSCGGATSRSAKC